MLHYIEGFNFNLENLPLEDLCEYLQERLQKFREISWTKCYKKFYIKKQKNVYKDNLPINYEYECEYAIFGESENQKELEMPKLEYIESIEK